ncbi:MAG: FUSC family protein [Solirubrobacteraceae bacterium]
MPSAFAFSGEVLKDPVMATFAAFGSFAMLLLVDFTGPIRDRVRSQAALALTCGVLICLGTLVCTHTWLAAAITAVVAFAILFAGVVSSVIASASTPLLLSFVLPVSLPGPVSSIPDRLAGWGLASGASLLAISLLWPAPDHDPIRGAAIDACRAIAARLRADVAYIRSGRRKEDRPAHDAAVTRADAADDALRATFFATAFRPTGLSTSARAIVRLVDELRWLNAIVLRSAPGTGARADEQVCAVKLAAARTLDAATDLLAMPRCGPEPLQAALADLRARVGDLEQVSMIRLPESAAAVSADINEEARRVVTSLDPSFRALELSFVAEQVATNVAFAADAERRSWWARLLGRRPAGFTSTLTAAQQRAGSHTQRQSLWLHNSLRGAVGLGLAVLIADLTSVDHGFWVVFGTLSVLRSSALNTGQNIVRALAGTTLGFVVGAVIVVLVGTNTAVLWVLLPIAVLLAGLAPAAIGFAAGQAAFTLTLLILFNLIAPAGWKVGLVRIEDVAIGCAVSLAVGIMLWPRGAAAALGRALSGAYSDSAAYLAGAIAYGLGRCGAGPAAAEPTGEALTAAASARRLDDTFRGYIAERGAKPVPLAEVTTLVTGVAGLRLAADSVLDLWQRAEADGGDRAAARRELNAAADLVNGWYHRFADSLAGAGEVPIPLAVDAVADGRLVDVVGHDLRDGDGHHTATAVRVIWTGDHLDAVRRLQDTLVTPARQAVSEHALG